MKKEHKKLLDKLVSESIDKKLSTGDITTIIDKHINSIYLYIHDYNNRITVNPEPLIGKLVELIGKQVTSMLVDDTIKRLRTKVKSTRGSSTGSLDFLEV
ncbi:hypothetical protein A152_0012625 [Vibrio tasmaniensis 1F-187]|uniref:hypothetical protein n=1 Tax=unclassified Vibrio TaxID=2614977 RepID=UPI0002E83BFE|nr:hypothetical protein [Vibrio tasmaniensis]OEF72318.1 hypothetical protein A152_01345 [Vibrio tasmaniensis 1F-187]